MLNTLDREDYTLSEFTPEAEPCRQETRTLTAPILTTTLAVLIVAAGAFGILIRIDGMSVEPVAVKPNRPDRTSAPFIPINPERTFGKIKPVRTNTSWATFNDDPTLTTTPAPTTTEGYATLSSIPLTPARTVPAETTLITESTTATTSVEPMPTDTEKTKPDKTKDEPRVK